MSRAVVTMALGPRYQPLHGRMLAQMHAVGDPTPVVSWANCLPPGAPDRLELPWLAYCAKPFAMLAAAERGYTSLLWLDAACYPIRNLTPLWDHIEYHGHYAQDNGFPVGEWCSDAALHTLGVTRDEAFGIPETSTMALGIDLRRPEAVTFLDEWARLAVDGVTFLAAHANDAARQEILGRRLPCRIWGHVSDDPRVMGHRHDQTAASVLAWRRGWQRTPRPVFADYWREEPDERTVVVNRG